MKKRNHINSRIRLLLYSVMIGILVVSCIYQFHSIWQKLSVKGGLPGPRGSDTGRDLSASLLAPYEMYLTLGDTQEYVRICDTSGYYPELWSAGEEMIALITDGVREMESISEEELPGEHAVLILQYACSLEQSALREWLPVALEDEVSIREIWIQPAISDNEQPVLYFLNWEQQRFYRINGDVPWDHAVNQSFCEELFRVGEAVSPVYLDGRRSFPEVFLGGSYLLRQELIAPIYDISYSPAFTGKDGSFQREEASRYAMHFFAHPDVVKAVEEQEDFIWYADEKRTLRMESSGLLQYVETPEKAEREKLSLTEAYQLAMGFLEEDMECDDIQLLELYLAKYAVDDGGYTFWFNYKLDTIPFVMDEEKKKDWGIEYPVTVTVEGSVVRYYERYLVDMSLRQEQLLRLRTSYIDVLDQCRSQDLRGTVQELGLCYVEREGTLRLCWRVLMNNRWQYVPAEGEP